MSDSDPFEIVPASISDLDDITQIFCDSLETDTLHIALNSNLTADEHFANIRDGMQAPKFANPLYIWYKAVEKQSRKTVGWACIRLAGKDPAPTAAKTYPPPPDRMNKEVLQYLNDIRFSMPGEEGYDPEKHLCRSGLHVHPDFQRRGVASRLSRALDEVADREGKVTFVRARPAATAFFESQGWTLLHRKIIPYRELGVDLESDYMAALRREPMQR